MSIVVFRKRGVSDDRAAGPLLRFLLGDPVLSAMVFEGHRAFGLHPVSTVGRGDSRPATPTVRQTLFLLPEDWAVPHGVSEYRLHHYASRSNLAHVTDKGWTASGDLSILNGRYTLDLDHALLQRVLSLREADLLAVTLTPRLLAYREELKLTGNGYVAGLRRYYDDAFEPAPLPNEWPHLLLVRAEALDTISGVELTSGFGVFVTKCKRKNLSVQAFNMAGIPVDLETESGILALWHRYQKRPPVAASASEQRHGVRIFGSIVMGKQAKIGANAILVGPSLIGEGAVVAENALVDSSIIGPGVSLEHVDCIRNRVIFGPNRNETGLDRAIFGPRPSIGRAVGGTQNDFFRVWPKYSYVRSSKRIADVLASIVALILFLPIVPVIVLAIKVNSPGPVLFRARRQGLHGKEFDCLKFRTMKVGADDLQENLRMVNEVDGPQFMMTDDPRISAVGRFLRETYLDEIPQFVNVLLGQMSLVGPRPSPKWENTRCPRWRDARLSVRPGITGLWQLFRTREPSKDFQEWIHYDIEYVRRLSFRLDLSVCWRTSLQMVRRFVQQF